MGNIPVILGAPNLADYWPFDSSPPWFDVLDYYDASALSRELISLMEDPDRYRDKLEALLRVPSQEFQRVIDRWMNASFTLPGENSVLCRICKYMDENFCE